MITRRDLEYLVEEFENYGNPEVVLETPDHIKKRAITTWYYDDKTKKIVLVAK